MSSNYVCDYCGESIDSQRDHASVHAIGWEQFGDYHVNPCLGFIRQAIEAACGTPSTRSSSHRDSTAERRASREQWDATREGWTQLSLLHRERLVIETIGEGKMSVGEILARWSDRPDMSNVLYGDVYPTVRALYKAGELDRAIEPVKGTRRSCQHYFRKTELAGPIADLERALDEP